MDKVIYRKNSILHGCDTIEAIFRDSNIIAKKRNIFEACVYLVGQYADKTKSSLIRYYWCSLRHKYELCDYGGFRFEYRQLCDKIIYNLLGRFAWHNTLTL